MKRFMVSSSIFVLAMGANAALAETKPLPSGPSANPAETKPAPEVTPAVGPAVKIETPPAEISVTKLGPNVRANAHEDCGTTACQPTFCIDTEGNSDQCHPGAGGCSGDIDTGFKKCQDGEVERTCPGNQNVHLQTCSCTCLGNACGTHIVFKNCQ